MKIANIVLYPLQGIKNYYTHASWGMRVVCILTGALGSCLLCLFLKNKLASQPPPKRFFTASNSTGFKLPADSAQVKMLSSSEVRIGRPMRKVEDIGFLKNFIIAFKGWLDEKIQELDQWKKEDSDLIWARRVVNLKGLKEDLKQRLDEIVSEKDFHGNSIWENIQNWAGQWDRSSAIQPVWEKVLENLRQLKTLDEQRCSNYCLILVDFVKAQLQVPLFDEDDLQAHLSVIALKGGDSDNFGIQRGDFGKLGLRTMKDIEALNLRCFDGYLQALCQDAMILKWAEDRQGQDFDGLRSAAIKDMKQEITAWKTAIGQSELNSSLDACDALLNSADIQSDQVKAALDQIENQNKKRQCALIKSHIISYLRKIAETQLQDVKILSYKSDDKIDGYIAYLAPDGREGDRFGMKRENFFKVGLYNMCDLDALKLRKFDQPLQKIRREALIFERAQKSSDAVFLALIPEVKEKIRAHVSEINNEIETIKTKVGIFKEDPTPALSHLQTALQNLVALFDKAELRSEELDSALDRIEEWDKTRQCAFLRAYILQQDIMPAWVSLNTPSLAAYCENYKIDPYVCYELGVLIAPPAPTSAGLIMNA